jgi:hypothetical protein
LVAFVLVGVRGGEPGDGLIEDVGPAEVGGDRDPVTGAGVRTGQRPAAQFPVHAQAVRNQGLDGEREFPVAQLADVEVAIGPESAHQPSSSAVRQLSARLSKSSSEPVGLNKRHCSATATRPRSS